MKQESVSTSTGGRRWKRWLAVFAGLCLVLFSLMLSRSPTVDAAEPPTAAQALAAQGALTQVRGLSRAKRPVALSLRSDEIDQAILLAGRAMGIKRLHVERTRERMWVSASQPLPLGFWFNVQARIEESHDGFPAIAVRAGRLPIPAFLCRAGMIIGRVILIATGSRIPPLDSLVRMVQIDEGQTRALLYLPGSSGIFRSVNTVRGTAVDPDDVVKRYCALSRHIRDNPSPTLDGLVRAAFADAGDPARNSAALVAVAMTVVSPQVGLVAGDVPKRSRICAPPPVAFTLLGRADLAKHWALSAALSATYGEDMSHAIGRFKELADSGSGGSGFSFVDLAADRSGVAYGRRAIDADNAEQTAQRLKAATESDLLPVRALALAEGLSEAEFIARYQNIESENYGTMEARIDQLLNTNLD
jgi:uncharacterized protein YfiM (DUF2279 family)